MDTDSWMRTKKNGRFMVVTVHNASISGGGNSSSINSLLPFSFILPLSLFRSELMTIQKNGAEVDPIHHLKSFL